MGVPRCFGPGCACFRDFVSFWWIVEGYNTAATNASQQLDQLSQDLEVKVQELRVQIDQTTEDVIEGTEEATDTISTGTIWLLVATLVGAALSIFGGKLGVTFIREKVREERI